MSHFTTVDTKINDLVCLGEALDELGLKRTSGEANVRGWRGSTETADMVISTGSSYDVGVRRLKSGFYELVADWWGVETGTGKTQEDFLQPILQRYAYLKVKKEVQARGFQIAAEKKTAKQELKLTVRRWQG